MLSILILVIVVILIICSKNHNNVDKKQSISNDNKIDANNDLELKSDLQHSSNKENALDYYKSDFRYKIIGNTIKSVDLKDVEEYQIPYGTEKIENILFRDNLKKVICPSTLKSIGDNCFFSCKKLKEVILNEGLTEIGKRAFSNCNSLEKINFPKSLKKVGGEAFYSTNLREAILPDDVELGEKVFDCCDNLFNLRLPAGVTEISSNNISDYYTKIPKGVVSLSNISALHGDVFLPKSLKKLGNIGIEGIIHFEGTKEEFDLLNYSHSYKKPLDVLYNCQYEYESYESWPRYKYINDGVFTYYNNVLLSINTSDTHITVPDGIRWVHTSSYGPEEDYKVENLVTADFPKTLIYIPIDILLNAKKFDYSKLPILNYDYYVFDDLAFDDYEINYDVSNIHPKNMKYSDRIVFNKYAPVLAFENDSERLEYDTVYIKDTYLEYIKTPSEGRIKVESYNNLYIKKLILTPNATSLLFGGNNCIEDIYIPNNCKKIRYDGNYEEVIHIKNVYYEGSEEQWKELTKEFNDERYDLVCDNIYFNNYGDANDYSIERLKKIEKEIGITRDLPNKTPVELIEYSTLHPELFKLKKKSKKTNRTSNLKKKENEVGIEKETTKAKSNTVEKSKENVDDYVSIKITNHRDDEVFVFGKYPKDTNLDNIKSSIKDMVCGGYENIIEHGDAGFYYADNDGLFDAVEEGIGIEKNSNLINSSKKEYKNLFANKDRMRSINVYIDALNYYTDENDILIDDKECSFEEGLEAIKNESPEEIIVLNYRGDRIGVLEDDKFVPDDGVTVTEDITKCKTWYAIDNFDSFYFVLNTKIRPGKTKRGEIEDNNKKDDEMTIENDDLEIYSYEKVKVRFDDGKEYLYNCELEFCLGDKVKVSGKKSNEVGTIISIEGDTDSRNFMQDVTEIVHSKVGEINDSLFEEGIKEITPFYFENRNLQINKIILPKTVKKICSNAFEFCENINEIILNDGLEEICDFAFEGSGIGSLSLPKSLKKIGDYGLYQRYGSIRTIEYHSNLDDFERINGDNAISNMTRLNNGNLHVGINRSDFIDLGYENTDGRYVYSPWKCKLNYINTTNLIHLIIKDSFGDEMDKFIYIKPGVSIDNIKEDFSKRYVDEFLTEVEQFQNSDIDIIEMWNIVYDDNSLINKSNFYYGAYDAYGNLARAIPKIQEINISIDLEKYMNQNIEKNKIKTLSKNVITKTNYGKVISPETKMGELGFEDSIYELVLPDAKVSDFKITKDEYKTKNRLDGREANRLEKALNSKGIYFLDSYDKAYYLINYFDDNCRYCESYRSNTKNYYYFFCRKEKDINQTKEYIIGLIDDAFEKCIKQKGRKFNYKESSHQIMKYLHDSSELIIANYNYKDYDNMISYIKDGNKKKLFETIEIKYDSSKYYASKNDYDDSRTLADYLSLEGMGDCSMGKIYVNGKMKREFMYDEDDIVAEEFGNDYIIDKVDYLNYTIKIYLKERINYIEKGVSTNNLKSLFTYHKSGNHVFYSHIEKYIGKDKKVYIPDEVNDIDSYAFKGSNVEEIHFGKDSVIFKTGARLYLDDIKNLKLVTFEKKFSSLFAYIFYGCPKSLIVNNGNEKYKFEIKKELMSQQGINDSVATIKYRGLFCHYLTKVPVKVGDLVKVTGKNSDKLGVVYKIDSLSNYDASWKWEYVVEVVKKLEDRNFIDDYFEMVKM